MFKPCRQTLFTISINILTAYSRRDLNVMISLGILTMPLCIVFLISFVLNRSVLYKQSIKN